MLDRFPLLFFMNYFLSVLVLFNFNISSMPSSKAGDAAGEEEKKCTASSEQIHLSVVSTQPEQNKNEEGNETAKDTEPIKGDAEYEPVITEKSKQYSFSLFQCSKNIGFCMLTAFCPLVGAALISRKMKQNICYGPCCGVLPLNLKMRSMVGIEQNMWNEGVQATFCWPCFTCRLHNELEKQGF